MKPEEAHVQATEALYDAELAEPSERKVYSHYYSECMAGTPEEAEYMQSVDALHKDRIPSHGITSEKPEHRLMLFMKVQGMSNREIATKLGFSTVHVSQVTRQPWFRLRLVDELKRAGRESLVELFKTEGENSFQTLVEIRDNTEAPAAVRKSAADSILDRILGKPVQKIEERRQNVSTPDTVAELDREIAALEAEARRLTGGQN